MGHILSILDFPGGSDNNESTCNAGDPGSINGLEGSPGDGNGYPLPVSCLDGGTLWAMVHGVTRSQIMYFTVINTVTFRNFES